MPLEIKKQERETSQSLIRRFSKRIKQSGIILEVRRRRFKNRTKSRPMRQRSALRRLDAQKEYKRKVKLGEIEEFKNRKWR